MKYLLLLFYSICLIAGAKYANDLYITVQERKAMMEDYAEINMANYELFNMQLWKEEALEIMENRIRDFEISQTMYQVLNDQIQAYLKTMYKRYFTSGELASIIVDEVRKSGKVNKLFMGIIEKQVPDMIRQINLTGQIPVLSKQIIAEIKSNEPLIKQYMQQELLRLVLDDANKRFYDRRQIIYDKYKIGDLDATDAYLLEAVQKKDGEITMLIRWVLGLLSASLVIAFFLGRLWGFASMVSAMTATSIILLVLGVSMPMIDIDARLNSFAFELLGEAIEFDQQIIYYQSKSIVEVTKTLWKGGTWDLKVVGALVLMFSIVFPFIKLLLSGLFLWVNRVRKSRLAQGIIFHLGKWSMADVFVVAIFMAYIGFYGIISTQLNSISQNQGGFAIETLNYSRLSPGAFFFTAYTILSIFISILINTKANKQV